MYKHTIRYQSIKLARKKAREKRKCFNLLHTFFFSMEQDELKSLSQTYLFFFAVTHMPFSSFSYLFFFISLTEWKIPLRLPCVLTPCFLQEDIYASKRKGYFLRAFKLVFLRKKLAKSVNAIINLCTPPHKLGFSYLIWMGKHACKCVRVK